MNALAASSASHATPATSATSVTEPVPNTHSNKLRKKIALSLPPVLDAVRAIERAPLKAVYAHYLLHLHSTMRASVPLMERTVALCRTRPTDQASQLIANYLQEHIPEERGHDEWVVHDLGVLGISRARIAEYLPLTSAASLIGTIHYYVEYIHPVAEMGYIAFAEGYPLSAHDVARWVEMTGLPDDAFTCLRRHSVIDPLHRADFDAALDQLPLDPALERLLGVSAIHTAQAVSAGLLEVVRRQAVVGTIGRFS